MVSDGEFEVRLKPIIDTRTGGDPMTITNSHPWNRRAGESFEDYSLFLFFRNVGPSRTLRAAYTGYLQEFGMEQRGPKVVRATRSWRDKCAEFEWVERAAAWDAHNLQTVGARIAALHGQAMLQLAERMCRAVHKAKPGDASWGDLLRGMQEVGSFLTPELVTGIYARFGEDCEA